MKPFRFAAAGILGAATLLGAGLTAPTATALPSAASVAPVQTSSVIVRSLTGDIATAKAFVLQAHGTVTMDLDLIDGVAADVPVDQLAALSTNPAIRVSSDAPVQLHGADQDPAVAQTTASTAPMTPLKAAEMIGADSIRADGFDGSGIGVAIIDSGVSPVVGMNGVDLRHGPDLSFEAGAPNLATLDTFGHGTHLAGIIASGTEGAVAEGIAPGATLYSVKVADAVGATDVSQVIAALGWVIENKNASDVPIRVLHLAFGTDSKQSYVIDPLSYAVEQAWQAGIVVVVAAGNDGNRDGMLDNPAIDPFVIAVAADDTKATASPSDDEVPTWSSRGNGSRDPDVVAPGVSILSHRVPGSYIDTHYGETGLYGKTGFKGSGTSQATAVTAGAVALLLDAHPSLTPDQVKLLLRKTAKSIPGSEAAGGAGLVDLAYAYPNAARAGRAAYAQTFTKSNGTGSLEASRGSAHVQVPTFDQAGTHTGWRILDGEETVFGTTWNGFSFNAGSWSGGSWSGGSWSGGSWSGGSWSGGSWSAGTWSGGSWSGGSWSGGSWSGGSWSGGSWSGGTWSGGTWSSSFWS